MRSPWARKSTANQDPAALRALLQEAKKKGWEVFDGYRLAVDDPDNGPIFLLTGVGTKVRAYFNADGKPQFKPD